MKILGITGPTGAGKTTVLRVLEQMGSILIDADEVYHEMLRSHAALRHDLEQRFGDMTDQMGEFDRKKLGTLVFQDAEALQDLNRISHHHIVQTIRTQLEQASVAKKPFAVIDAVALFESGLADLCDVTVAVIAPPDMRIQRIMAREGISEEYARMRVEAQQPDVFFMEHCGYTLVNDCDSAEEFACRAKKVLEELCQEESLWKKKN